MNENLIAFLVLTLYFSPVFYQLFIVIKERKKGNIMPFKKLLRFLKTSFFILLPLVIGFFIISHTNYFNYEKPIAYSEVDRITFKNFRGLEFFRKSLYGNEHFAYVVTSIESEIYNDSVSVQSFFHPSRSFVYNSHSNSKELLTHEIYHFKITELYARKAKKRISKLTNKSLDKIKSILIQVEIEKNEYQKKYDYDTFHSYVFSEQKKYEKEVDSLLDLHLEFKNPKILIHAKN